MSCLFTLIFTQEGVTQHLELLWQDGINEPEQQVINASGGTVPPLPVTLGAGGVCVHTLHLSDCTETAH